MDDFLSRSKLTFPQNFASVLSWNCSLIKKVLWNKIGSGCYKIWNAQFRKTFHMAFAKGAAVSILVVKANWNQIMHQIAKMSGSTWVICFADRRNFRHKKICHSRRAGYSNHRFFQGVSPVLLLVPQPRESVWNHPASLPCWSLHRLPGMCPGLWERCDRCSRKRTEMAPGQLCSM